MLKIGLTGGIGSGKTTVANLFVNLGVPVIDMDVVAREVVMPGQPALEEIKKVFGDDICLPDGQLDRKTLRNIIFSDSQKRQQLEAIVHPAISTNVDQQLTGLTSPYCLIVIPLLFETSREKDVDRILVVDIPVEEQINRTMARDGVTHEDAMRIIQSQVDRETRLKQADDVINNTDDKSALSTQVKSLHQKYLQLSLKN
ncbi:MAG: dephospho-CoA kinase [Gammaproteobacteria bacterium]|nr:dephospho-CoA kinase [Gammaproteobacteria bacterium]